MTDETRIKLLKLVKNPVDTLFRLILTLDTDPFKEATIRLYNQALCLPDRIAGEYREELDYLQSVGAENFTGTFPYEIIKDRLPIRFGFDNSSGLPYVIHRDHHLYFPKKISPEKAGELYSNLLYDEGILGDGCRHKSPHCYTSAGFSIDPGDIVLDIGSAEGLFALEHAGKSSRTYVFEPQKQWQAPLKKTFLSFGEKVTIVPHYVSDHVSTNSVRLFDVIQSSENEKFFIKMDIEGAEQAVIRSCREFLTNNKVKMSCCTYHRQDDAKVLSKMLKDLGFSVKFSDGYMLPALGTICFPFFRKGMIYAQNY